MSLALKSKSKDKNVGKELQKSFSKPTGHANAGGRGGGGVPASGYNPLLGTYHALESAPVLCTPNLHVNRLAKSIDEADDHSGNSFGTGIEHDYVSNNGNWSGESEDHKEKISYSSSCQEAIPRSDNDKRGKICQKNERKHQRQKERRAQELHEKCSGYLMSRKLEALAQQLVAMGFSSEQATMALILNESKVEESVAWLFEGDEEANKKRGHNIDGGCNLKIDISEELSCIADMEIRYKCSKQEVERAIVASEGDLEKADEALKAQRQEPPVPPKPEETGDPPTVSNGKLQVPISQNLMKIQPKTSKSSPVPQKGIEEDVSHMKVAVAVVTDGENNSAQALKRIQPKLEWEKLQQFMVLGEKRWAGVLSNPAVAYSVASSLQYSSTPAISETQYVAAVSELKNLQLGSVREPVVLMQRPQSTNTRQPPSRVSLSTPGTTSGWYGSVEKMKSNGLLTHISSTRSLSPNNASTNQLHNQYQYQYQQQQVQQIVSTSGSLDPLGASQVNGLWNRPGTSPTLAAASSLGLFSGIGSNGSLGSSSSIDWNTGSSLQFDYTNIDWSMDWGSSISRRSGVWQGVHSFMPKNALMTDSCNSGRNFRTSMIPVLSNGNGVSIVGLQHGSHSAETPGGGAAAAGSREWASPFEEKDLFNLPRQFVSSPSL